MGDDHWLEYQLLLLSDGKHEWMEPSQQQLTKRHIFYRTFANRNKLERMPHIQQQVGATLISSRSSTLIAAFEYDRADE